MAAPQSVPTPSTSGIPGKTGATAAEATGLAVGAAAGAAAGAIAGPPGMIAGAILGAVAGVATGKALVEGDELDAQLDEKLDEEIGVTRGSIGVPMTTQEARIGAYSAGSAGTGENHSPSEDGGAGLVGSDDSGD